jgi:peptidoglycan hydrolase-like protein with peptidoglycan-binding domain
VLGGPVGALIGAGAGAATGAYREPLEQTADDFVDRRIEQARSETQSSGSIGMPDQNAMSGGEGYAADDLTNEEVRRAQTALQELGHYDGRIDGLYGPKSIAAVGEFQQEHSLPQTFALDERTQQSLQTVVAEHNTDASAAQSQERQQSQGDAGPDQGGSQSQ